MCVLLDDFSESKNVRSIRALAPHYCCNTLRLNLVAVSSNQSHFRIDQWYICSINLVSPPGGLQADQYDRLTPIIIIIIIIINAIC